MRSVIAYKMRKNEARGTTSEKTQNSDPANKDVKATIINIFKKLKDTML